MLILIQLNGKDHDVWNGDDYYWRIKIRREYPMGIKFTYYDIEIYNLNNQLVHTYVDDDDTLEWEVFERD